jgi:hypothetical protein
VSIPWSNQPAVADVNVSEREYVSRVSFYDRQALDISPPSKKNASKKENDELKQERK